MSDTKINAGRETRAKFWPVFAPYLLLVAVLIAAFVASATAELQQIGGTVVCACLLVMAVYLICIQWHVVRRMHDAGVSRFFFWMLVIVEILSVAFLGLPLLTGAATPEWVGSVNLILVAGFCSVLHVALLVFFLLPSQAGTNDYGENPEYPGVPFTGTSWGGIVEDMLKLMLVMGTLGYLCNLAMKPFEQTSDTDSLVSLIRKGALETDKNGEEIDNVYLRELATGKECNANFVNTADSTGRTPLMWAVYANYNNPEDALSRDLARLYYVQNLLSQPGIDVQAKDKDGFTALHWASWSGMPYCSLMLVEAGLDVNAKENNGYTPLMLAAMRGNNEAVRMLLSLGADASLKNNDGLTAAELVAGGEGAYNKRDNFWFSLIFSSEREAAYRGTIELLSNPPAARSVAEWMDDMARMSGEARAERLGTAIIEVNPETKLTVLLETVLAAGKAENTQEYDAAIHYFVLGQLKAIAEREKALADAGKPVATSAVLATDAEGRNALDIALQFGLTRTVEHLRTVLQPSAAAPECTPAEADTPVLPTPALDAEPATAEEPVPAVEPTPAPAEETISHEAVEFTAPDVTGTSAGEALPTPEPAADVVPAAEDSAAPAVNTVSDAEMLDVPAVEQL